MHLLNKTRLGPTDQSILEFRHWIKQKQSQIKQVNPRYYAH